MRQHGRPGVGPGRAGGDDGDRGGLAGDDVPVSGARVLEWLLLLPLAVPGYLGAYALVDFLEYAGPVQTALRAIFGWTDARDYFFPDIRSLYGAIFVLTASLYPYVYLLARAGFREQSGAAHEVARALGAGRSAGSGASACRWRGPPSRRAPRS